VRETLSHLVPDVIRNLRADFDLTMGLAGVASVRDIGRENVTRPRA